MWPENCRSELRRFAAMPPPRRSTLLAALSLLASAGAAAGAAAGAPFDLALTPPDIVARRGAACLDGSPTGVYLMRGAEARKWRVHFHGGGFCASVADCEARAQGQYGSSRFWPASVYDLCDSPTQCTAVFGLLSNYTENPMGQWNAVLVPYCDGSSWTSNRAAPLGSLHFRGRANLDAVVDQLEALGSLTSAATDVVITGTSAGGVVVFEHATHLRSRLPAAATVVSVPDAGVFLDAPNISGASVYPDMMRAAGGPALWNATIDGADPACLAHYGPGSAEAWKCLLAQYLLPFATVPTFVINSQYDVASMNYILQPGCSLAVPGQCSAQQAAAIAAFRAQLLGNITAAINATASGGFFLHSCWQHESSCRWLDYTAVKIGGVSMMDAFVAWYDGVRAREGRPPLLGSGSGGAAVPTRVADGPYGSDATCLPQDFVHGGC